MSNDFRFRKTGPNTYELVSRETGEPVGTVQRGTGRDANTWSGYDLAGARVAGPYPGSRATLASQTFHELTSVQLCEWFVNCRNVATLNVKHPILGLVPTCQRCADKLELTGEPR